MYRDRINKFLGIKAFVFIKERPKLIINNIDSPLFILPIDLKQHKLSLLIFERDHIIKINNSLGLSILRKHMHIKFDIFNLVSDDLCRL